MINQDWKTRLKSRIMKSRKKPQFKIVSISKTRNLNRSLKLKTPLLSIILTTKNFCPIYHQHMWIIDSYPYHTYLRWMKWLTSKRWKQGFQIINAIYFLSSSQPKEVQSHKTVPIITSTQPHLWLSWQFNHAFLTDQKKKEITFKKLIIFLVKDFLLDGIKKNGALRNRLQKKT